MRQNFKYFLVICSVTSLLLLSGCFGKVNRTEINYYVLEYQDNSELPQLRRQTNTGKIVEVLNTNLAKAYDRNQIVVKENFYKVRYLQNDVWASKLRDVIPNLIAQRLRAYNIFGSVSRGDQTDKTPHYFLETTVLNIEKIEGLEPQAYLRIEFVLRDSLDQNVVLSYKNQRSTELVDQSMVYLVQSFNDMLMEETNIFAAKCNQYFSGKLLPERATSSSISHIDSYIYEKMPPSPELVTWGELMVRTKTPTEEQIRYTIEALDSLSNVVSSNEWDMGKEAPLKPGNYRVILGESNELVIPVQIKSRQRSAVKPIWGELKVVILDQNQTRYRTTYDLWRKNPNEQGYTSYRGGMFSVGDEEIGAVDKLWMLPPGSYLVKLGGGSWSDLRNFATVTLAEGDRKTLTFVTDPSSKTGNIIIGAGVFTDDDLGYGSKRWHKGAVHINLDLTSQNEDDKDNPKHGITLSAQFDNSIDIHDRIRPFHFTSRSMYDLGLNVQTGSDLNFIPDDYSLRNVLLLYPMEKKAFFKNFAFYGRADVNTHFFDNYLSLTKNRNYMLLDSEGNYLFRAENKDSFKNKIAFYPLLLKQGTGITYRINYGSNTSTSFRFGYGWQQDYNNNSYLNTESTVDTLGFVYDVYKEEASIRTKGLESMVILSAMNIFNFLSLNSILDLFFPMGEGVMDKTYRFENENRLNVRLFGNIGIEMKLNIFYNSALENPYWKYVFSSNLRLSMFY